MRYVTPFFLTFALAAGTPPDTKIKIDTVPAEYRPNTGDELPKPVSMESFHFEVNDDRTQAQVVVEYTYPYEQNNRADGDSGPPPTWAQLPGLTYDPSAHAVVYDQDGKRTVCAVIQERKGRFGRHVSVRNTGSCVVTAAAADHTRFGAIDIYFEVH
jgi:hypothetical protein